ncbi:MAG: DUF1444 family protein [Verrucomicrobiota bacterium]
MATSDDKHFREEVIEAARKLFPGAEFKPHPEKDHVVLVGENQLGLQNLRSKFDLIPPEERNLSRLVSEHFTPLLSRNLPSLDDLPLDEVQDKLFPQIMPGDFTRAAPSTILSFPFARDIRVGVVADFPDAYMYVRLEDLERWKISADQAFATALENLETASADLDMHFVDNGPNTFAAVASGDGYDAVRILLPGLQSFLAQHLGETFRFGIPNRDFLICWRLDCDDSFHQDFSSKVAADHGEQPYPLSPSVFVRNEEGNMQEQPQST